MTLGSSTRSRYTRSRRCELKTQEVWVRAHLFNAALVEQRRHILCGTGQAGRREPVLFHPRRSPQLSRPGHHPSNPRRPPAARSDDRQAAGALASAAGVPRAADRARLCLSPVRTKPTKGIVTATNLTRVRPVSGGCRAVFDAGTGCRCCDHKRAPRTMSCKDWGRSIGKHQTSPDRATGVRGVSRNSSAPG